MTTFLLRCMSLEATQFDGSSAPRRMSQKGQIQKPGGGTRGFRSARRKRSFRAACLGGTCVIPGVREPCRSHCRRGGIAGDRRNHSGSGKNVVSSSVSSATRIDPSTAVKAPMMTAVFITRGAIRNVKSPLRRAVRPAIRCRRDRRRCSPKMRCGAALASDGSKGARSSQTLLIEPVETMPGSAEFGQDLRGNQIDTVVRLVPEVIERLRR